MKRLFLLPVMLIGSAAMAETVSPDQALDKAMRFLQMPARTQNAQAAAPVLTLAHTAAADGETYYYVFNNAAGGYVIVGGDDVACDVLAYGETEPFDLGKLPPAMKWWLGQYEHQIHRAIQEVKDNTALRHAARRTADQLPAIEPLLGGIMWNQDLPYNAFLPGAVEAPSPLAQIVTGCGATSVAQVMRYWNYPERGMAHHAYSLHGDYKEANFANSEYRWDLMRETYDVDEHGHGVYHGTPEEDAVALLMSDVGIAYNMEYGPSFAGGSGAEETSIAYILRTYFGYDEKMEFWEREENFSDADWEALVYAELAAGRPVIYNGANAEGGGHSFVCDGYEAGRFHINWGWNGSYNDYFLLTSTETETALSPDRSGIGGNSTYRFDDFNSIVIGIQPDPQSEGFVYLTESAIKPVEMPMEPMHLEARLYNPTSNQVDGTLFFLMRDRSCYVKDEIEEEYPFSIPAKAEVVVPIDIDASQLVPGVAYEGMISMSESKRPDQRMCLEIGTIHVEGPHHVAVIMSGHPSTLCLPFECEVPEGMKAYTIQGMSSDNELILVEVDRIEANRNHIITSELYKAFWIEGFDTTGDDLIEDEFLLGNRSTKPQLMLGEIMPLTPLESGEFAFVRNTDNDYTELPPFKATMKPDITDADVIRIKFVDNDITGIQQIGEQYGMHHNQQASKFIDADGRIMIRRGERIYNALGVERSM